MAKIENNKLIIDGFVYVKSRTSKDHDKIYWDCRKVRSKECRARAITDVPAPGSAVVVLKGPVQSPHEHAPNRDECTAEVVMGRVKRKAAEHPKQPPAHIIYLDKL